MHMCFPHGSLTQLYMALQTAQIPYISVPYIHVTNSRPAHNIAYAT